MGFAEGKAIVASAIVAGADGFVAVVEAGGK